MSEILDKLDNFMADYAMLKDTEEEDKFLFELRSYIKDKETETQPISIDNHSENIDTVLSMYKNMMFIGMAQRQKNKWVKLFEPQLEHWFEYHILKLIESGGKQWK